jgi:ABC-type oligopeptide transport system ATPase subunit
LILTKIIKELRKSILSISGESGTGKTTLAQQIIGYLLLKGSEENSCIWIQASEKFSQKRFRSLFPERAASLMERIFLTPPDTVFQSYEHQASFFKRISNGEIIFPPGVSYMVIDNISHHLRYAVLKNRQVESTSLILNNFFEDSLLPLIFFCKTNSILLLLLHEVSYNPENGRTEKFYNRLYRRLDFSDIILENDIFSHNRKLIIKVNEKEKVTYYNITQQGIVIK